MSLRARATRSIVSAGVIRVLGVFVLLGSVGTVTACHRSADSYFPLQPGWQWRYALHIVTADGTRQAKYLIVNLQAHSFGGTMAVPRRTPSGATWLYVEDAAGVKRVGELIEGHDVRMYPMPQTVLRYPLSLGSTWHADTRTSVLEVTSHAAGALYRVDAEVPLTYTVESIDDAVSVPAGSYANCVRVKAEGRTWAEVRKQVGLAEIKVESTEWYAPGVGLIRAVRRETTSSSALPAGEYEMQLESLR